MMWPWSLWQLRRQLAESRASAQALAERVVELDGLCQRQQAQAIDLQRQVDEYHHHHHRRNTKPKKRRARK